MATDLLVFRAKPPLAWLPTAITNNKGKEYGRVGGGNGGEDARLGEGLYIFLMLIVARFSL